MEPKQKRKRVSAVQYVILSYLARSRDGVIPLVRLKTCLAQKLDTTDRTIAGAVQALHEDDLVGRLRNGRVGCAVDIMIYDAGRRELEGVLPLLHFDAEMLLALRMVHKASSISAMKGLAIKSGFPMAKIMPLLDDAYLCGLVTSDRVNLTPDGVAHLADLKERHELLAGVLA